MLLLPAWPSPLLSAALYLLVAGFHVSSADDQRPKDVYYIVVMLPDLNHSNYPWMFGLQRVKPAIDIALEKVVENTTYTSGFELVIRTADSKCDISHSINEAFTFYMRKESTVFFGPCCDYAAAPIARQISFWNIPMVTTGAMASDFSKKDMNSEGMAYGYLTRVGPTINSLISPIISLMKKYKWTKFKQVYDAHGQKAVDMLCHFVADGLHNHLRDNPQLGVSETHAKINMANPDYEGILTNDIANDHGGESKHP